MRKITIPSLLCILSGLIPLSAGGCAHHGGATKMSPDSVPPRVRESMEGRFPGAQVISVEKEKENGNIVYDYELKLSGRKYETDIKEDGTIMEIEKQLVGTDVPDSVTRAVHAKYPNATVKEVMEVNKVAGGRETPDHYEVTLSGGGAKEKEVNVSMNGEVSVEAKGHE